MDKYNQGHMVIKTCPQCGKAFQGIKRKIYCSHKCMPSYFVGNKAYDYNKNISTAALGTIGELGVCNDLFKAGYHVFRSVSPDGICDLIAIKNSKIRFIEVRSAKYQNDGKMTYEKKSSDIVTEFAVFCHKTNEVHYFDKTPLPHRL